MEDFWYGLAVAVGVIVAYIFGRGNRNDGRRTLDRVDDTLGDAESELGDVGERVADSVDELDRIESELDEVSDAVTGDKQRLADAIKRIDDLGLEASEGSERHRRIKEIATELRKRYEMANSEGNDDRS